MKHNILNCIIFFLSCLPIVTWANSPAIIESNIIKAIIFVDDTHKIDTDQNGITIPVKIGGITEILKLDFIKARELQAKVKIQPDDRIGVILGVKANAADPTLINEIKSIERPTNKWRWGIFLIVFIFVIGVFSGISMLLGFKWNAFIVGADNRYSNSKFQIVLWFFTLFTIYLTTLVLRIKIYDFDLIGGIGITENLLALSGLSAFTYGSAKAITMSQIENTQEELDHANVQVAAAGDAAALNVQRRIADAAQHNKVDPIVQTNNALI